MVPQKLSHRHRALALWMLANPHRPLKEAAKDLGYTTVWVYHLANSDMFRAYYERLCREHEVEATHTLASKVTGAAALALDRTIEALESPNLDPRFLHDTTRTLLEAIGYRRGEAPAQKHLHLHVTPEDLKEARQLGERHFNS